MPNKSYQKGYRFQQRVKRHLEKFGYFVMISPRSKFPDGVAIKANRAFLFECKWNKFLSKEEKLKAKELVKKFKVDFIVFWNNKRKIDSYKLCPK